MNVCEKLNRRLKRGAKTRYKIYRQQTKKIHNVYRICIHKTPTNFYAQLTTADGAKVLCSISTLERAIKSEVKYGGNVEAAKKLGNAFAERIKKVNPGKLAFDRRGYKYHGRIKAFADSLRESGIEI